MAKAVSYDEMDEMDRLLRGESIKQPESSGADYAMDETVVVPEAIKPYDLKETPLGGFARKNFNSMEQDNFDMIRTLNQDMETAAAKKAAAMDTDDHMMSMLARRANAQQLPARPSTGHDAEDFQKGLKKQMDELNASPADVAETDKLIAAFGPVLLSAAFGAPGGEAGVKAFDVGQKELDKSRTRITDDRKSKILGLGKQIEGTGNLLKAETERRKQDMDEQNKSLDRADKNVEFLANYSKWRTDNRLKDNSETQKRFLDQFNKGQENREKGILETTKVGENAAERDWKSSESAMDRSSAEKRAKFMAQAAKNRQMDRPPTEGMTASANAYSAMTKASQAFDRMKQDVGYIPSMSTKFFDTQKQLFERADRNMLMGDLLKQIPDAATRRQIQTELDWLAPKLRKESGAAISVGEFISEGNRYFPRRGDDDATQAEKLASRKQAVENFKVGAGRAPLPQIIQPELKPTSREDKLKRLKELEGK